MKASIRKSSSWIITLLVGIITGFLLARYLGVGWSLEFQEGDNLRITASGADVRLLVSYENSQLSVLQELPKLNADLLLVGTDTAGGVDLWLGRRARLGLSFDDAGVTNISHWVKEGEQTFFVFDRDGDALPDFRTGEDGEIEIFLDGTYTPAQKVKGKGFVVGDEIYQMVDGVWEKISQ